MGADVNSVALDFTTPLWQAAYSHNLNAVELLLESGASLDIQDTSGRNCLHAAVHRRGGESVANLLISNGIDINQVDKQGVRPIHIITSQGNDDLFLLLLEYGALIN